MTFVDTKAVKSARRVLEIFEYFGQNDGPATVMNIVRALGYPQSSTSELLSYLAHLGYLTVDRYKRTYKPTARVAMLGTSGEPKLFRKGHLWEMIDGLAESTGETIILSGVFDYTIRHINIRRGDTSGSFNDKVGSLRSLVHSPHGRLVLSTLGDDITRQVLHRTNAEAGPGGPIVRFQDIQEDLLQIRERGYVIGKEGQEGDFSSIVMMLPYDCRPNRLMLSLVANDVFVEANNAQLVRMMQAATSQFRQLNIVEARNDHFDSIQEPLLRVSA